MGTIRVDLVDRTGSPSVGPAAAKLARRSALRQAPQPDLLRGCPSGLLLALLSLPRVMTAMDLRGALDGCRRRGGSYGSKR
jgi:hypothetical protein